ncbi:uncharacterized protein KIAA1958 homolog [Ptychodera flava]|uniref:uncharacterized protein KIAA1958 homolog n=1 Tax=Ptychodera flava TaxID=63121 RepID=UPI00396A42E0
MDSLTDKIYDKENCIYLSKCEDDFYYPEEQSVVSEAKSTLTTQDVSSTEPLPGPSTSTTSGVAVKQRFASVLTEDALNHQIALQKNTNTANKTRREVAVFNEWKINMTAERRPLHEIPPADLDNLLASFFWSVKMKNGKEYEPDSLSSYQKSIDRHLREMRYNKSIIRDDEFQRSRESLAAKRKKLKAEGKGNMPCKASALTESDETKLIESGQLGTSSPDAIINTVWFNMTKLFGLRGSNEHHQMTWGDVVVKQDQRGEYLEYNERVTKTRKGEPGNTRKFSPKAYAVPDNKKYAPCKFTGSTSFVGRKR